MPLRYTVLRTCARCGETALVQTKKRGVIPPCCRACHAVRDDLGPARPPQGESDREVVARLVAGRRTPSLPIDRYEAVRRLRRLSASEIAARLGVSRRTVQRYRSTIRRIEETTP